MQFLDTSYGGFQAAPQRPGQTALQQQGLPPCAVAEPRAPAGGASGGYLGAPWPPLSGPVAPGFGQHQQHQHMQRSFIAPDTLDDACLHILPGSGAACATPTDSDAHFAEVDSAHQFKALSSGVSCASAPYMPELPEPGSMIFSPFVPSSSMHGGPSLDASLTSNPHHFSQLSGGAGAADLHSGNAPFFPAPMVSLYCAAHASMWSWCWHVGGGFACCMGPALGLHPLVWAPGKQGTRIYLLPPLPRPARDSIMLKTYSPMCENELQPR